MIIKLAQYRAQCPPLDVVVDDNFYDTRLSWYPWFISRQGYVISYLYEDGKPSRIITLHRMVMQDVPHPAEFNMVDHINRDRRDNRSVNLRWCSCKQNMSNTHINGRYRGGF